MVPRSNHKHITLSGGKGVTLGIINSTGVERSLVLLHVIQLSNTPAIVPLGDHNHSTNFELEDVARLSRFDIEFDRIVGRNIGIGVTKSSSIMSHRHGDLISPKVGILNLAQLVLLLILVNPMQHIPALGVKQQTERIITLGQLQHIHKPSGEVVIGPDLSIHLHVTLHANLHTFLVGKGILQAITEDDGNGKAFALFVGSGGWLGCPYTTHFAQVPMVGGIDSLKVLLWSAWHD